MGSKIYEFTNTVLDRESGSVISQEKKGYVRRYDSRKFIKLYLDVGDVFTGDLCGVDNVVLWYCMKKCDYNNCIILMYEDKIKMSDGVLSIGSINNSITKLCRLGLLHRIRNCSYVLTPKFFWKGTDRDNEEVFRVKEDE